MIIKLPHVISHFSSVPHINHMFVGGAPYFLYYFVSLLWINHPEGVHCSAMDS